MQTSNQFSDNTEAGIYYYCPLSDEDGASRVAGFDVGRRAHIAGSESGGAGMLALTHG
jgi:hypothetical protein